MRKSTYITDYNCVTPLGFNVEDNWEALLAGRSGIAVHHISEKIPAVLASKINDEILEKKFREISQDEHFTRLEKMLILALRPIIAPDKISEKTAFILSTTKGNISLLNNPSTLPQDIFLGKTAQKIADFFGFKTKPVVVSNACVSGVMAISAVRNLILGGQFQDAYVAAADEVSEFVLSGFQSFQAISPEPCKPYDKGRDGISVGEAAAAAFITAKKSEKICFEILGESSINDANHISGPSRTGEGLYRSIKNAVAEAEIIESQLDFISAHGTATIYNDDMESVAFSRLNLSETPVNSLKGYYGHCLGTAGLLEIIMSIKGSTENRLIRTKNFKTAGTAQPLNVIRENLEKKITIFLKTASGFGGSNSAIILKKTP